MVSSSWRRRRHAAMLHQYWNAAIGDLAQLPGSDALSLAERAPIHAIELAEQREARKFNPAARTYR